MKAYELGITKEQFVTETKLHQKLDHFLKGTYSKGKKGCAVGCAIKSINKLLGKELWPRNHSNLEKYLGIPEWLARVQDRIFEGVSIQRSKVWPVEFAEAINKGSNLDDVKISFIICILEQNIKIQKKNLKLVEGAKIKEVINLAVATNQQIIDLHKNGANGKAKVTVPVVGASSQISSRAAKAAEAAAWAVESAAWAAAESAAWAAWAAAGTAAEATTRAAEAAALAIKWSAKAAAESARAASLEEDGTAIVAMSTTYEKCADKLLQLIRECK